MCLYVGQNYEGSLTTKSKAIFVMNKFTIELFQNILKANLKIVYSCWNYFPCILLLLQFSTLKNTTNLFALLIATEIVSPSHRSRI